MTSMSEDDLVAELVQLVAYHSRVAKDHRETADRYKAALDALRPVDPLVDDRIQAAAEHWESATATYRAVVKVPDVDEPLRDVWDAGPLPLRALTEPGRVITGESPSRGRDKAPRKACEFVDYDDFAARARAVAAAGQPIYPTLAAHYGVSRKTIENRLRHARLLGLDVPTGRNARFGRPPKETSCNDSTCTTTVTSTSTGQQTRTPDWTPSAPSLSPSPPLSALTTPGSPRLTPALTTPTVSSTSSSSPSPAGISAEPTACSTPHAPSSRLSIEDLGTATMADLTDALVESMHRPDALHAVESARRREITREQMRRVRDTPPHVQVKTERATSGMQWGLDGETPPKATARWL